MNIKFLLQRLNLFVLLVVTSTFASGCGQQAEQAAMMPPVAQVPMVPPPAAAPQASAPQAPMQDVVIKINNQLKQISKPLKTASKDKKVIIDVETFGRDNPFKPFYQNSVVASSGSDGMLYPVNPGAGVPKLPKIDNSLPKLSMYGMSVDAPIGQGYQDPSVDALLGIKVAGILYDSTKPMAILNIDGEDQLVQEGDKFKDYIVSEIGRSKVTIKKGRNTFRAGIGQIIDGKIYDNSEYYNVNKHFAGGKKYVINTEPKYYN